jgi:uncharacterized protein YqjF (DUF2071 family)
MRQEWAHLLFLHWAWDAAAVQRTLPAGLTVDTFDGRAWIGLVPFFMQRVRPANFPALPGLSNFLELNVRTYVHDANGRPGVWFYSLDCNQWLAVKIARRFFHLPYEHAGMRANRDDVTGEVDYAAGRAGQAQESRFLYRPTGEARPAEPGSLEFFMVERYTLFAHATRGPQLFTGRVAHAPYQVTGAEVPVWDDGMMRLAGFDPAGRPPDHRCTAATVNVEIFPLRRAG